jgi:hypothetical protein
MGHESQEDSMFRLASFVGFACLALVACALVGPSRAVAEEPPQDPTHPTEDRPQLGRLIRMPAQGFHACFSVN